MFFWWLVFDLNDLKVDKRELVQEKKPKDQPRNRSFYILTHTIEDDRPTVAKNLGSTRLAHRTRTRCSERGRNSVKDVEAGETICVDGKPEKTPIGRPRPDG